MLVTCNANMSADQLALSPPPIDDNLGPGAVRICTPILVFGIIFYIIRIVTRVTPIYQLNITDYAISGAVVGDDRVLWLNEKS